MIPTLRAVLRAEVEGHRALLEILRLEQAALGRGDEAATANTAAMAHQYVKQLESLARHRMELLMEAGMAVTPDGVEADGLPRDVVDALDRDWATLRAVAMEAQEVNTTNGRLIAQRRSATQTA